jgi:DNA-binding NtrC family response regulator
VGTTIGVTWRIHRVGLRTSSRSSTTSRPYAELIGTALREAGYEVTLAHTVGQAEERLRHNEFDVALLDMRLPDGTGADVLRRLVDEGALTESIVLTGSRDIAQRGRGHETREPRTTSPNPFPSEDLEIAVGQARDRYRLRTENQALRLRLARHEVHASIVTEDPEMQRIVASLAQVGPSDLPVLVQGESGTGKELIARAVHDSSPRKGGTLRGHQLRRPPRQPARERTLRL